MPASQGELGLSQLRHVCPDSNASAPCETTQSNFSLLSPGPRPRLPPWLLGLHPFLSPQASSRSTDSTSYGDMTHSDTGRGPVPSVQIMSSSLKSWELCTKHRMILSILHVNTYLCVTAAGKSCTLSQQIVFTLPLWYFCWLTKAIWAWTVQHHLHHASP